MEVTYRISTTSFQLMAGLAIIFDLIQFNLGGLFLLTGPVGWILYIFGYCLSVGVTIVAWLTFYIWFKAKGISIWESIRKYVFRTILFVMANLLEIIPSNAFVPGLTISVVLTVLIIRLDDRANTRLLEEGLAQAFQYIRNLDKRVLQ